MPALKRKLIRTCLILLLLFLLRLQFEPELSIIRRSFLRIRLQRYDYYLNWQKKTPKKFHQLTFSAFLLVCLYCYNSAISSTDSPVYLAISSAGIPSFFILRALSRRSSSFFLRSSSRPSSRPSARPSARPFL